MLLFAQSHSLQTNRNHNARGIGVISHAGLFGGRLFPKQQSQPAADHQPAPKQSTTDGTAPRPSTAPGTPANPEFPPYKILKQGGAYGLRLYDVYPVVEMEYQRREEGYLYLGNYLGARMQHRGRKVMQMMVGSPKSSQQQQQQQGSSSITSLPAPSEPAVRLAVAGGELVAVSFFEGYITPQTAEAARERLIQSLAADGISLAAEEAEGFFRVGQYGQVHTLEARVNELLLRVQV